MTAAALECPEGLDGIPQDVIFVPRLIRDQSHGRSRLVVDAVDAYCWRGAEGGDWNNRHRAIPDTVFGHVATSAWWSVQLDASRPAERRAVSSAHSLNDAAREHASLPDAVITPIGFRDGYRGGALVLRRQRDDAVCALLYEAARERAAIPMRLNRSRGEDGIGEWVAELAGPHGWWTGENAAELRRRVRFEHERLALMLAEESGNLLPALPDTVSWRRSEVHRAARGIVCDLGRRAWRKGWTRGQLSGRVADAISFLLRARGGGLGAPFEVRSVFSTLVSPELIERVIAAGTDPVTDHRTRAAYQLGVPPRGVMSIVGDHHAMARLREVPDLVAQYLSMRWLRYGPLSAVLARTLVLKELVLFTEIVLETPTGVLDGRLGYGESLSFKWSDRGQHPRMLWALRSAQALIGRLITTGGVLFVANAMDARFSGWIALAWFFGATRLRTMVIGKSRLQVKADILGVLERTWGATTGTTLPVDALRHVLQSAVSQGAAFDGVLWQLIADAERSGDVVWDQRPPL